jgi:hypothetical protein
MYVPGMRAEPVVDFFLHPTDELYQHWWPGVHFLMHPLNEAVGIGQLVHMDELVGTRRLRFTCIVASLAPGAITWQFRKLVRLPCWLDLRIVDDEDGATITHTIRAGYGSALGRLLDPFLRLYLSPGFERMMDEHFRMEFSTLPRALERKQEPLSNKGIEQNARR